MADQTLEEALTAARQTIAEQSIELSRLRAEAEQFTGLAPLKDAIQAASAAGTVMPRASHRRLLRLMVETAASVVGAETASIFLIDPATDELVFEVALGQDEDEVRNWRLPAGTGIVGLVAASGQPMAIAGVQDDPRHAADVAERLGRRPTSLLCVPLFLEDEVIGVLELVDKRGAPGFTTADMDTIALFANQAAVAITQSRAQRSLYGLLQEASGVAPPAEAVADTLGNSPEFQRSLELAALVGELAARGAAEANLAADILRAVTAYAGKRQ
jgi:GAF domain-containing protein